MLVFVIIVAYPFLLVELVDHHFLWLFVVIGRADLVALRQNCQKYSARDNEERAEVVRPQHQSLEVEDVKHERNYYCYVGEWHKSIRLNYLQGLWSIERVHPAEYSDA